MAVKQHVDEPIVVITLDDQMDEQAVASAYLQSVEMTAYPVFRLVDIRTATLSHAEKVSSLRELVKGLAGAAVYPEMRMAFLGTPSMTAAFAGSDIPFFASYEDAHSYVADHRVSA